MKNINQELEATLQYRKHPNHSFAAKYPGKGLP
jgi:hypothetical protein